MSDRVRADNPAVETVRATLERAGRTDRPVVALPADVETPDGPVRLVLDGRTTHARIERGLDGTPSIRAAYDSPRPAREGSAGTGDAPNRLAEWVAETGLAFGRSVLVDVVESGDRYGLRAPGESAVYETGRRDEGLAAIAAEVEDRTSEAGDDLGDAEVADDAPAGKADRHDDPTDRER